MYLTCIITDFQNLVRAGVEGIYSNQDRQKCKVISAEYQGGTETETSQVLVIREYMTAPVVENFLSSHWGDIACNHVNIITDLVCRFIQSVYAFVIRDNNAQEAISYIITAKLDDNAECALQELVKLLDDKAGCPITYNHYYIDNV
ncbi:putative dynamin GTPase [Aspergillus lentulus]|nr:putative dynamin GTPase [Aspergillus lentulus]